MSSNTNLGNTPVNQGYVQLFHTGETGGVDTTLRIMYDGDGTASDLYIATNKVKIGTSFQIGSSTAVTGILDENNMASDSDVKLATQQSIKAYVDTEVADLIDSAPSDLNTLKELAEAINDDDSYAATITTALGTKLVKASNLSDLASASTARSNLGLVIGTNVLAQQTIGIANDNLVEIDDADAADNDYAKFTANGLEGRSYSETRTDLGLVIGTNVQAYNSTLAAVAGGTYTGDNSIATVGTIGTGTWQGTEVGLAYGGTELVGETDGKIVIADGSGAPTHLDVGSSSGITILGTIGTGVWNGTKVASAYLDDDTAHLSGTQTFSGAKTFSSSITLGGHSFDDIDIGSEFTDADDHIMSAGAIKEKIEDYGYTTNTGDMTGVDLTGGTGISIGSETNTTSGAYSSTISLSFLGLEDLTDPDDDRILFWDDNVGDIEWLDLSNGLAISGSNFSFDGSSLTDMTETMVTGDEFVVLDGSNSRRKRAAEIGLSIFNNDSGFVTSAGVTSNVAGSGIDVSGATGAVTISIGTGEVVNAMIGNDEVNSEHYAAGSIDNEHLADDAVDSDELAAGAVDDAHLSDGVATGLAGAGTTATSGVLNVIGGTGITANANDIEVDVDGLSLLNEEPADDDTIPIYDEDASSVKKVAYSDLISGATGTITGVASMTNNYVLTATAGTTLQGEQYLTFDGTDLKLPGDNLEMRWGASDDFKIYVDTVTAYLKNVTQDGDIRLQVNDGGSNITAIKIDASEVGKVMLPNDLQKLTFGVGGDGVLYSYEDNFYVSNFTAGKDTIFTNLNSDSSAYVEIMRLDGSTSRVGIGTTSPADLLHIADTASSDALVTMRTQNSSGYAEFGTQGNYARILQGGTLLHAHSSSAHYHYIGGNAVMGLTSAGLGIGTIAPASDLVVRTDTSGGRGGEISIVNYAANAVGNEAALNFGLEASTYNADNGNAQIKARVMNGSNAASDMIFSTWNGSAFGERVRIDSSGHVLIGGTSVSGHTFGLEVLNDNAYVQGPDGWNGAGDLAIVAIGSAQVNESFGCGYKYGTGMILSTYKSSGGGSFGSGTQDSVVIADTTGAASFINDVIAYASSDKRLKENIKPLDNALDKINKINGVEFDWIDGKDEYDNSVHSNTGHDVGVIAQEIEEVLPEVVTTRDNGYKAVKYEKIVPLLIEAIKEQQEEIDLLKANYDQLKYNRR